MEAPSTTSDFEEDEAEIAERGARAWHFFEGGFAFFASSSHSHTTREERAEFMSSLLRAKGGDRIRSL